MEMVATLICIGLLPLEILAFLRPTSATFLPYALRRSDPAFPVETQTTFYREVDGQLAAHVQVILDDRTGRTWYSVLKTSEDGTWETLSNPTGEWKIERFDK